MFPRFMQRFSQMAAELPPIFEEAWRLGQHLITIIPVVFLGHVWDVIGTPIPVKQMGRGLSIPDGPTGARIAEQRLLRGAMWSLRRTL
jgi:hypothetical protein